MLRILRLEFIAPFTDQLLVSASNFLTVVIIARALAPEEFGFYVLLYTSIMMLGGIQSSLITGPMRVLGVGDKGSNSDYFQSQTYIQISQSLILAIVFSIILSFFDKVNIVVIIYSALSVFFIQFYEYVRVVYLTKFHYKSLLISDLLVHLSRLIFLYILYINNNLTVENSFLVIFSTSAISLLLFLINNPCLNTKLTAFSSTLRSNWNYGKWLLLETIAFLLSSRIYIYLIGFIIGLELAGVLAALQNILNTTNVIVMGLMAFITPVARRAILNESHTLWVKYLLFAGAFLITVVTLILFIMSIFSAQLVEFLYSEYYGDYSYLIPVLAVAYVVSAINSVLSAAFRTVEQPEKGAKAKVISAIFTLILAYPLLLVWGLIGAALGLIFAQLIWLLVYSYYIVKGSLNKYNVKISSPSI